jgi:hypothetical protein
LLDFTGKTVSAGTFAGVTITGSAINATTIGATVSSSVSATTVMLPPRTASGLIRRVWRRGLEWS